MTVAVLGDGPQASMVARAVAKEGYPVYAFGAGPATTLPRGSRSLTQARIMAVDGTAGKFSIYYENQGNKETLSCGAIIAAPEACPLPNAGRGDLTTAMDLASFAKIPPRGPAGENFDPFGLFWPGIQTRCPPGAHNDNGRQECRQRNHTGNEQNAG